MLTKLRLFDQQPFSLIGARILQVVLGVVILLRVVEVLGFVQLVYGRHGIGGGSFVNMFPSAGPWLDTILYSQAGVCAVLVLWALGGIFLLLGWYPRLGALLGLFGTLVINVRSPLSIDAGDILMFFCLMFALFLHPSVVTRQPANRGLGVYLHNLAIAALYAQVILVYVNAGWLKLDVESAWYEGTALYYTTHLTNLPLPFEWMLPIFENSFIVTVGTYLSLVYLIGFPFALFSSYHWFWVLMGIGFHGGIAVLMGLYTFSLLMIGLTLLCVRDEEWAQWGQVVVNWAAKIVPSSAVYIDGYCSYCRATGSAIARFDWLRRVDVRDFRGDSSYRSLGITDSDLEAQMHLVGGGKILRGYDAVLGVLARVPLGMVFWPLAKLAGWLGLGPLAYRWLSEHRVIVPNSELCRTDACQVKGSTVLEDEP